MAELLTIKQDSKQDKLDRILTVYKFAYIVFSGSLIIKHKLLGNNQYIYQDTKTILSFLLIVFSTFLISTLYYFWSLSIKKKEDYNKKIYVQIVDVSFFAIIFAVLILVTGRHMSQYKVLFLFLIIIFTIQYGKRLGLIVSTVTSLFILGVDLGYKPASEINQYFEDDLVISALYILTSWLIIYYSDLERQHALVLEDRGNKDSLTGLYNHRYFHSELTKSFNFFQKKDIPISLIFIDIDYFKQYNDMLGHQMGDYVLKYISQIFFEIVNERAVVSRYGGDEFAIILNDVNVDNTYLLCEELRAAIDKAVFFGQEHLPSKNLTISIGIAVGNSNTNSEEDLIRCADDALYRAKFFKKNRVEIYKSIFEIISLDTGKEEFDLISSFKTLISIINAKDRYTYGHTERVVFYSKIFANKFNLDLKDKKNLLFGAYMHDIGKLNIPDYILNKKMPLNEEEWNVLKEHPDNGIRIIENVKSLCDIVPIVRHHHEKFDGSGYPDNLKETQIPYLARILSIIDSFDAMTFTRPYSSSMTFSEAVDELIKCRGIQFDPDLVDAFVETINNQDIVKDMHVPFYNND